MVGLRTTALLGAMRVRVGALSLSLIAGCGQLIGADFEQRAKGCRELSNGRWRETCAAGGDTAAGGVASGDAAAAPTVDAGSGTQTGGGEDGGAEAGAGRSSGGTASGLPVAGAASGAEHGGAGEPDTAGNGGAGGGKPEENPPGSLEVAFAGPPWPTKLVRVCWPDQMERPDIATHVEAVVRNTWGRSGGLRFVAWGYCPVDSGGWLSVELNASSEGSVDGIGEASVARRISLGINMANFDAAVVHLFGHALGFAHGKLEPEVLSGECEGNDVSSDPGDYWARTIMSPRGYCGLAELGARDVEMLQAAYGRKGSGALVGLGNRCLDIPGDAPMNRLLLQVYECNFARNQSWYRDSNAQIFAAHAPGLVLDVALGASTRFLQLFARSQPAASNQQFFPADGQLRAIGDSCLGLVGDGDASVEAGPCSRFGGQSWQVGVDGRIQVDGGCLTGPPPDATAEGSSPLVAACDQSSRQIFAMSRTGEVRQGTSCLDVVDPGDSRASRPLRFASCRGETDPARLSQLFYYRGRILIDGQCLHITGQLPFDYAGLETVACSGSDPSQHWDYYFTDPP